MKGVMNPNSIENLQLQITTMLIEKKQQFKDSKSLLEWIFLPKKKKKKIWNLPNNLKKKKKKRFGTNIQKPIFEKRDLFCKGEESNLIFLFTWIKKKKKIESFFFPKYKRRMEDVYMLDKPLGM